MTLLLIILIAANIWMSWKAFEEPNFMDKYLFRIGPIIKGERIRMLSSGFLHGSWMHLGINMYVLYSFGEALIGAAGPLMFSVIYFTSLIGGNILSFLWNKKDIWYSAVGASGAVSGVVFAMIAINPTMGMGILFIPISFPAWVMGIAFVGYSIYGMLKKNDNIGHEAHLGGAIVGFLLAMFLM